MTRAFSSNGYFFIVIIEVGDNFKTRLNSFAEARDFWSHGEATPVLSSAGRAMFTDGRAKGCCSQSKYGILAILSLTVLHY
jgi:hypothetical protein